MEELDHPNVVHYKHAWVEPSQQSPFTPCVPTLHVLMNAANGGSLADWIEARSIGCTAKHTPQSKEVLRLATDTTRGLAFLHERGILHLDIKPGNVLLHWHPGDELPTAMLSDFGSSRLLGDGIKRRTGHTGTIEYMAPEAVIPDGSGVFAALTGKSDVWSLGIVFYMLTFLDIPYSTADNIDMLWNEIAEFRTSSIVERLASAEIHPKLKKLLPDMLSVSPERRPTSADVLDQLTRSPKPTTTRVPWHIPLTVILGYVQCACVVNWSPIFRHVALLIILLEACAACVCANRRNICKTTRHFARDGRHRSCTAHLLTTRIDHRPHHCFRTRQEREHCHSQGPPNPCHRCHPEGI